jgi:hypothetical protein
LTLWATEHRPYLCAAPLFLPDRQDGGMRPRAIAKLAAQPVPILLERLGEGMTLIAEHVAALEADVAAEQPRRASAAIRVVSEEEAGKYLVLLDAARCARAPIGTRSRQLKRANEHLAKGIYARAAEIRPATFTELGGYVRLLRRSHYLDGPNDVDWIFRNEIEARREERLYVDFVETDDGDEWQTPQTWDGLLAEPPSDACELVAALDRVGFSTDRALAIVAEVWDGVRPVAGTHWQENRARTVATLEQVAVQMNSAADPADLERIADTWSFPLWHVDLTRIDVDLADLRQRQQDWDPDFM